MAKEIVAFVDAFCLQLLAHVLAHISNIVTRIVTERFDRTNNLHGNDLEKNQIASSRGTVIDHGDGGSSSLLNENSHPWFIALEGCCSSQAFDLLNNRMCLQVLKKNYYIWFRNDLKFMCLQCHKNDITMDVPL